VEDCNGIEQEYGFYRQTRDPPEVGQFLAEQYAESAWCDYSEYDEEDDERNLSSGMRTYLTTRTTVMSS